MRIGPGVELVHEAGAGDRIGRGEFPAAGEQQRLDQAHRHHAFELLERAQDHGAVAPRTRPRDVEMVAPGGGGKRRAAVGGDKGAERGRRPHERAVFAVALFVVDPFAVDQYAHARHSSVSLVLKALGSRYRPPRYELQAAGQFVPRPRCRGRDALTSRSSLPGLTRQSMRKESSRWRTHVTSHHEGLRLLFWRRLDGTVEFANLGAKNDLEIF